MFKSILLLISIIASAPSYAKSAKCLKPFIYMDDSKLEELRTFLEENLSCFDSAQYEQQSYVTYAVKNQNVKALTVLHTLKNDALGWQRFFNKDLRQKSAYDIIIENIETYKSLLRPLYEGGFRATKGPRGESLADLSWIARDGDLTADLYFNEELRTKLSCPKCSTTYEYVVDAAQVDFAGLIREFSKRTQFDLQKKYPSRVSSKQLTLLDISLERQLIEKNHLEFEVLNFYIEKKAILNGGVFDDHLLDSLVKLREFHKDDSADIKKIDDYHLLIAQNFPVEWIRYIDGWHPSNVALLKSIINNKTIPYDVVASYIIPKLIVPKISALLDSLLKDFPSKLHETLLPLFSTSNRYPSESRVYSGFNISNGVSGESYARILIQGLQNKLYAAPTCSKLFTRNSGHLSIDFINDLLSFGMAAQSCKGVTKVLSNSYRVYPYLALLHLYKIAQDKDEDNSVLPKIAMSAMDANDMVAIREILQLGMMPTRELLELYNGRMSEEILLELYKSVTSLSNSDSCKLTKSLLEYLNYKLLQDSTFNSILEHLLKSVHFDPSTCPSLVVRVASTLNAPAVGLLLSAGANPNDVFIVEHLTEQELKYNDEITPLMAVGQNFSLKADGRVIDTAKLLIEAGADLNKSSTLRKIYETWPNRAKRGSYRAEPYQYVNRTYNMSPVGAAIYYNQLELYKLLVSKGAKIENSFNIEIDATEDFEDSFSSPERKHFSFLVNTPQEQQVVTILGIENRFQSLMKTLSKTKIYETEVREKILKEFDSSIGFDLLKYFVSQDGPNQNSYQIFPITGAHHDKQGYSVKCKPDKYLIFPEGITLMRWARMRWHTSSSNESEKLLKELSSFVDYFKKHKGDASDFESPKDKSNSFYYALNPSDKDFPYRVMCWGGADH